MPVPEAIVNPRDFTGRIRIQELQPRRRRRSLPLVIVRFDGAHAVAHADCVIYDSDVVASCTTAEAACAALRLLSGGT